jgi:hypothetical protein
MGGVATGKARIREPVIVAPPFALAFDSAESRHYDHASLITDRGCCLS